MERRQPGRSGRCCYRCYCRCLMFYDYIYIYIYTYIFYLLAKKLGYFLRNMIFPSKLSICFGNMNFSFENMSVV